MTTTTEPRGTLPCGNPWWLWLGRQTRRQDPIGRFARFALARNVPVALGANLATMCDTIAEHLRDGDDWQALCDGYSMARTEYADRGLRKPRWKP